MSDVYCAKCGEPWDSYGCDPRVCRNNEGDMTASEAERLRKGEGCPCCAFGEKCPVCCGTGIEANGCKTCSGHGKIMVRRLGSEPEWHHYGPKEFPVVPGAKLWTPPGENKVRSFWNDYHHAYVYEAWAVCPECGMKGEPCSECKGDGKLHRKVDPMRSLSSILDGTDEEPIEIIQNFKA